MTGIHPIKPNGPLQFEDALGNKMSDTEFHMHVQQRLLGGVDKAYFDAVIDDPFAS